MDPSERKPEQRIAKRKEKVEKMITAQQAILATLDSMVYQASEVLFVSPKQMM